MEPTNNPFSEPDIAGPHLHRVTSALSPDLAKALPGLLQESPDPDSAVIFLERFFDEWPDAIRLFERGNFLLHYAVVVFGHSRYLAETLIKNPDLLQVLLREKNLDRSFSREEFEEALARLRSRSFETDISRILSRFKRREYIRIMLRDVLKLAPLAETTAEISALSDVLLENALREANSRLQKRYGTPQHVDEAGRRVDTSFAILSFGKLGGNELNYSSDVDLLYVFGDGEAPSDAVITNHEYFVRLAQEVTEILCCVNAEGPVFRIDLRLRPQGNEGELAVSVGHALRYYAESAHDWERQALIKLRHSAGDVALGRRFIRSVQPYVYNLTLDQSEEASSDRMKADHQQSKSSPNGLNFSAIKTALDAREKMAKSRNLAHPLDPEEGPSINIKLGRGGIRDVEFLVQCLQRVYGGTEPWLRSRGTLFALQKLHDKRHISGHEFHELTSAYEFLRHLEHRLQLQRGRQIHRMPMSGPGLTVLQRAMEGYAPGEDRGADLRELVRRKMAAVAEIYQRVIDQQSVRGTLDEPEAEFHLRGSAFVGGGEQSNIEILERLAVDAPSFYKAIAAKKFDAAARKNLFRFLSSAFTSSERYAAIVRHPEAAEQALALFETSEYLTEILARYPEEIAALAELRLPAQFNKGERLFDAGGERRGHDPIFEYLANSQLTHPEKISLLRRHYRRCVLLAGMRDITELRGVYESLAETTATAEDAINASFRIAGAPDGLAVMAVGRLGSGEFDVLSDADLLFVCAENLDPLEFSKTAGQLMQILAAYTQYGMLFPVDTRLRPHGAEGELVITTKQLRAYFFQEAQPWEALMYTKMRFVAGNKTVGEQVMSAAETLFDRFSRDDQFQSSITEMRSKLENAEPNNQNFKTGPGGTYDVDFLTAFLLIKHGIRPKNGTLRDRLWRCVDAKLLSKSEASGLDHSAELLRTLEHAVRLVAGRAHKWLPPTEHAREVTEHFTARILNRKFAHGLEVELKNTLTSTRAIYAKLNSNSMIA